ncbi:MAG TPA: 1,4-dihydroxy-2-naphthoate polyprenyltransferase [Clostridiaceae bacterium]|nr:1,4-dihydroxy-2-naphthoate polyprenyltransferase [Clostridiaceae bacterium]
MHVKSFLKLVEIQTKIASVTPFAFGILYTVYRYGTLNVLTVLFFFISMLCFDMFTTALNNYKDYKRAIKREGYNYEVHNAIGQYKLKESTVLITIITLFIIASIFGILTFLRSDIWLLVLGMLCFAVGILYSAGPLPISRTPFGEVFSGLFMGFFIPFLVVHASIYDQYPITLALTEERVVFTLDWTLVLPIFLSSLPAVFCIANIMLANNICDVEDDFTNRRYTLPIQIGREKALILFAAIYALTYLDIISCVVLGYLPVISLLALLPAVKVYSNVRAFFKLQTKKDTFALSVMNLMLIMFPIILSLLIAVIIKLF